MLDRVWLIYKTFAELCVSCANMPQCDKFLSLIAEFAFMRIPIRTHTESGKNETNEKNWPN